MYEKITGENAYEAPTRIDPAVHYTIGVTWVDYELMSTLPGLFVLGEANFPDHGANRLGASALMQGLADRYFILPYTIGDYLARHTPLQREVSNLPEFQEAQAQATQKINRLLNIKGKKTVEEIHKELGRLMWHK